jgi:L-threonylcarbamoyladenylate synthase
VITECNNDIAAATRLLTAGQVVAIPTETVYGLAANAYDTDAVLRVFSTKQRPLFNPLIVHTDSLEKAFELTTDAGKEHLEKAMHFWPGPLTVLVPKSEKVHDLVTAGSPLVAIRIPDHPMCLQLLSGLPFPLAAPSANRFGAISPTTADHVLAQLGGTIPMVLDGGPCQVGLESTIIKPSEDAVQVLRKGAITASMLEQHFNKPVNFQQHNSNEATNPEAPGMLKSHYAPDTPLFFGDLKQLLLAHRDTPLGVLGMQLQDLPPAVVHAIDISPTGDLKEAARNLFSALRALDQSDAQVILADSFPDYDLGMAINDRLQRAAMR